AVLCQNGVAYVVGYWSARSLGVGEIECRTIALEVGIQNGGMATGLAINVLGSPVIALGSAVYGPWSAISSSILATYWRSQPLPDETPASDKPENAIA
ncbi:MAG: bile acid:sodium symporter family protein, partial [Blastopirellula sp. JB062]